MPAEGPISRRQFIAAASLAVLGGLLSACGGSVSSTSASSVPAGKPTAAEPTASANPATSSPAGSNGAAVSVRPAASPVGSAAASASAPTFRIAYPAVTGAQAPLFMAQELDLFAKHGVNVQAQFIAGGTATKALIANGLDAILQAATAMITADVNGAVDLVYVASAYNHAQFSLITKPAIKTVQDLKGKVWGTDHPGTTVDYFTQLLLNLLNLKKSDVELRVLGASNVLVPDLTSHQIDAAPISPPASFDFEDGGFHSLKDTFDQPYQNVGVVVSKARIGELTPALLRMLPAYREGMEAFLQQPEVAKKMLAQKAKITDQKTLDRTYDFYTKQTQFQLDLRPTMDGIRHMIEFLSATVPKVRGAKPEQFVDTRILDELKLS